MTTFFISIGLQLTAAAWSMALFARRKDWRLALFSILAAVSAGSFISHAWFLSPEPAAWPVQIASLLTGAALLTAIGVMNRAAAPPSSLDEQARMPRLIFDLAPEAYYLLDLQGVLVDANRAAEELTGYKKKEFIGKQLVGSELLSASQLPQAAKMLALSALGQPAGPNEFASRRKDGEEIAIEIRSLPIQIGETKFVLAIARDITGARNAERTIRESEERYRDLFENTHDLIQCVSPEGKFVYVNRAWREALGYSESETQALHLFDVIHPGFHEHCRGLFQRLMGGEDVGAVEVAFLAKDGRRVDLQGRVTVRFQNGQPLHTRGMFMDVTGSKANLSAMRAAEAQLNAAQRTAHLGSWTFDHASKTLVCSDELLRIFECPPSRDALVDAIHPEDRDRTLAAYAASVQTGQPYDITHRLRMPDGRVKVIHALGKTSYNKTGQPLRSEGAAHDITGRQLAEELFHARDLQLRAIGDSLPGSSIYQDLLAADGQKRFLYLSAGTETLFGVPVAQALEDSAALRSLVFPEDYAVMAEAEAESARRLMPFDCQARIRTPAGEVKCLHFRSRPTRLPNADVLWNGLVVDVTADRRNEALLRELNTRMEYLLSASPVTIYTCEPTPPYATTFVSENLTAMLGYSPREFLETPAFWADRIHPEDRDRVFAGMPRLFAAGAHDHEYRFRHKDGGWRWMRDELRVVPGPDGKAAELIGNLLDITARKESEIEHAAILETAIDGFWVADREGRLLNVNESYCRMTGYSRDELLRLRIADLEAQETPDEIRRHIQKIVAEGHDRFESRHRRKDGSIFEVEVSAQFSSQRGGSFIGFVQDITRRKQIERALHQANEELEQRVLDRTASLRESEDRYRDLVENSQDLICTHDLDGRILSANPASAKLLGYEVEDLLRMNLYDLFPPEMRGGFRAYVARIKRQGKAKGLMVVRTSAGERRIWAYNNTLRTEGVSAPIVRGMARDITERTHAEKALHESESRYRNVVASLPGAVYSFQLDSAGRRSMPFVSQGITALTGLAPEAIMENVDRAFALIPAEEMPLFEQSIAESLQNLSPWQRQFPIRSVDGETKWLHGQSVPRAQPDGSVVWHGVFVDITPQRRAQDAVRESERRYQRLVENIHDAIIMDDAEGRLVFANGRFREWFGLGDSDIRDVVLENYVAPEWRQALRDRHDRRLRGESVPEAFEYEGIRGDGQRISIEVTVTPVVEGGRIVGTQSALRDITERKRIDEQHRQAQKMETLGQLAGGIAHDFNNLLTVINGYSHRTLTLMDARDPLREPIGEILKAGDRAADLTRQLLAFSRRQVSEPKALHVNEMVAQSASLIRRMAGESVQVQIVQGENLGQIKADSAQFHQVLLNLVANARDAMPDGGHLVIDLANVEIDEQYVAQHLGTKSGHFLKLEVSDTGIGIDKDTQERIFEPFFTTKETGTGLGLATVHGIVNQHGGWIGVYSEPGMGTTFRVFWPHVEEPDSIPEALPPQPAPSVGTETILLVEDQPAVRRIAAQVLAGSGYRVLEAADGDEALSLCRANAGAIHLLLTDVIMPGMNGRELAERLTQLRPGLRVLFMSGYGENVIAKHGVLNQGVNLLAKPFSPDSLTAKVRSVLDKRSEKSVILIVDDEAAIRKLFGTVLRGAGHDVLEAEDGMKATRIVEERSVDLVITDLVMPEREGIEMIQSLHRSHPRLKIIAVSGAFGGQFLKTAAMLGAHAALAKPVTPEKLLRTVQTVLQR